MIVRRLLAGAAVAAFAVPLTAAAPSRSHAAAAASIPAPASALALPWTHERVLARADAPAAASPAPAASTAASAAPAPAPSADPAQTAKARAEYDAWAAGKPDLSHYIASAASQLPAVIPQVEAGLQSVGPLSSFTFVRNMTIKGIPVAIYRAVGKTAALEELISWDAAGKIQFIFFRPA